mmetsp:Transcript_1196/g.3264  ORF Transcript_1196/g.3264 Transcript_1196/m.3264 type:complete len:234 (-) Transcript_1196:744-1445(-)
MQIELLSKRWTRRTPGARRRGSPGRVFMRVRSSCEGMGGTPLWRSRLLYGEHRRSGLVVKMATRFLIKRLPRCTQLEVWASIPTASSICAGPCSMTVACGWNDRMPRPRSARSRPRRGAWSPCRSWRRLDLLQEKENPRTSSTTPRSRLGDAARKVLRTKKVMRSASSNANAGGSATRFEGLKEGQKATRVIVVTMWLIPARSRRSRRSSGGRRTMTTRPMRCTVAKWRRRRV